MKYIKSNYLVVSDYNWLPNNLKDSWVEKYSDNYTVFDKFHRYEVSDNVIHQKNVGQNIYDMLDFIINNYEKLPDVTIFCRSCIMFPKGRPKPYSNGNCSEEVFLKLVNNQIFTELHDFGSEVHNGYSSKMDIDGGFLERNNSWYFGCIKSRYFINLNDFFNDIFVNPEISEFIRFSPGASYVIPKENILKYEKYFYIRLREYVSWDIIIAEAHMLERALYTIFKNNFQIKNKYKKDQGLFLHLDHFKKRIYVFLVRMYFRFRLETTKLIKTK